jgi:hypothetical protein
MAADPLPLEFLEKNHEQDRLGRIDVEIAQNLQADELVFCRELQLNV